MLYFFFFENSGHELRAQGPGWAQNLCFFLLRAQDGPRRAQKKTWSKGPRLGSEYWTLHKNKMALRLSVYHILCLIRSVCVTFFHLDIGVQVLLVGPTWTLQPPNVFVYDLTAKKNYTVISDIKTSGLHNSTLALILLGPNLGPPGPKKCFGAQIEGPGPRSGP